MQRIVVVAAVVLHRDLRSGVGEVESIPEVWKFDLGNECGEASIPQEQPCLGLARRLTFRVSIGEHLSRAGDAPGAAPAFDLVSQFLLCESAAVEVLDGEDSVKVIAESGQVEDGAATAGEADTSSYLDGGFRNAITPDPQPTPPPSDGPHA